MYFLQCKGPCGERLKYRTNQCYHKSGRPMSDVFCSKIKKPKTKKKCKTKKCKYIDLHSTEYPMVELSISKFSKYFFLNLMTFGDDFETHFWNVCLFLNTCREDKRETIVHVHLKKELPMKIYILVTSDFFFLDGFRNFHQLH